jgi:PPOX class probable F420-dependent enzyme
VPAERATAADWLRGQAGRGRAWTIAGVESAGTRDAGCRMGETGSSAGGPTAADPVAPLQGARYVLLTTYRRGGAPVPTPVGPIVRDGKVYAYTPANSGKAKRVRRRAQVEVAACTRRGEPTGQAIEGRARVLDSAEAEAMKEQFRRLWRRQYGPLYFVMAVAERLRGVERCVIEVTPT